MFRNNNVSRRDQWQRKPLLSGELKNWLMDRQSLTRRLQRHYAHFAVKPLKIAYAKARIDECTTLQISPRVYVLNREVLLMGNQQAVIFADSVIPRKILRGKWSKLKNLGNQSLGATLFADARVCRTALRYKKIGRQHLLYQAVRQHLILAETHLWARRSVFHFQQANMMVTEVFLPQILKK